MDHASAQDDLDAAVLRLADAVGGRDQGAAFAEGLDRHGGAGDAAALQLGGDRGGAALRQRLVVLRRAGAVGVAGDLDPGRADAAGIGRRFRDDGAGAVGQVGAVEVEEDQEGCLLYTSDAADE